MADAFQPRFVDLVRNFTSTQGTGAFVLGPAVNGYTGFASALQTGDSFYYSAIGVDRPNEREVGRGTLQANGSITRTAIGGALTNFSSGTKSIALIAAAEWFTNVQAGSGSLTTVATRTALASSPTSSPALQLLERGREGLFVFDGSNLGAQVAADPNQGMYVAPASAPNGSSGAWVRKHSGAVDVRWFGAVADGDNAAPTDNGPAFTAAIALLKSLSIAGHGYSQGSLALYAPAGVYYLGSTTLDLSHSLILFGDNAGDATGGASVLKWAASTTGIRVQSYNTSGAAGTKAPSTSSGAGSLIRNLMLIGGYSGTDADYHGIHLRARATIRDIYIEAFPGDAIYANASAGSGGATEGNVNNLEASRVWIENCRNGLYLEGGDTNAGNITALDIKNVRGWGVYDSSFLGNTHVGHHVAGSASGPYKNEGINNRSVFLGCYSEGGQPPASIVASALVIGGTHGAGLSGNATFVGGDPLNTISTPHEATIGATTIRYGAGSTQAIFNLHNNAALSGGLVAKQSFQIGYEADGTTPLNLASISASSNTNNPATSEAIMAFGIRQYAGGGPIVDRLLLDGPSLAFRGVNDGEMDLGQPSARWKNGYFSGSLSASGAIKSTDPTAGVGYGTGAGGTVTQTTDKSTGVTLNKASGQITTHNASLAAAATVSFMVTNSAVAATDTINLNLVSGNATIGAYRYWVEGIAAGSFKIVIENRSLGAVGEALVFTFAVVKAVTA